MHVDFRVQCMFGKLAGVSVSFDLNFLSFSVKLSV